MDVDEPSQEESSSKKAKTDTETETVEAGAEDGAQGRAPATTPQPGLSHAFLSMLDPESLRHPTMPNTEEMSKVLLEVRKNAIRAEYGV